MSTTVQVINDKARLILQDQGVEGVRWLNSEIIGWVNSGQAEVLVLKPNALVNNESFQLTADSTKQSLPATAQKQGLMLLDIPRNLGADGSTPGLPIRRIDRRTLDVAVQNWHTVDPTQTAVRYFVYNPLDPKRFYIYPALHATAYIEIVYSRAPVKVAALTDSIDLDDIYENCLVDYVLYRAFMKDADFTGNSARADRHYNAFLGALGGKRQAEATGGAPAQPQQG